MSIHHQHLHILIEPSTRSRRALHPALAVTLAAGLNPHQAVDVRVIPRGAAGRGAEAGGRDVAPDAPFGPCAGLGDAALVDDELGRLGNVSNILLSLWGLVGWVIRVGGGMLEGDESGVLSLTRPSTSRKAASEVV